MGDENLDALPPHDRRRFFTAGLARVLRPLADYIEERLPIKIGTGRKHLRPPGAIPEEQFLITCYRCGSCADACPADAITMVQSQDENLKGTPHIDPDARGCPMCDKIACVSACPSGALRPVDRFAVRIGLARVDERLCMRTRGGDCRICVDKCPLGDAAIALDKRGRVQIADPAGSGRGCTGCGTCQELCPIRPVRAIRVRSA
jgi:ferredoxin-type protein NapG